MASKRTMTTQHKAALAEGRDHSRAVKAYLEGLQTHRPKRGRQRTTESVTKRLDVVEKALADDPAPLQRLQLVQERRDLRDELDAKASGNSAAVLADLEVGFVEHAKPYAEGKGITRAAFRELGVPARLLTKAGVR